MNITKGLIILGGAILIGSIIFGSSSEDTENDKSTVINGIRNTNGSIEL